MPRTSSRSTKSTRATTRSRTTGAKASASKRTTTRKAVPKTAAKATVKRATAATKKRTTAAKTRSARAGTTARAKTRTTASARGRAVAARRTSTAKSSARATKRTANAAFMKPVQPDDILAAVVGTKPMPRTEVTKKLWAYIKKNHLQDAMQRRIINADANLKAVFGGKRKVDMFQMTKLVHNHLSPT